MYAHSEFQPHLGPGSGYTNMNARAQPQDLNATVYDEGPQVSDSRQIGPSNSVYDEGPHIPDSRQKGPSNSPVVGRSKQ